MNIKKNLASYHKPSILQILPALHRGGVERGTIEIATALRAIDYNAIVASAGGELVNKLYQLGGKHINLPAASKNPITIYRNISKIENIIKYHDIDLIHARSRAPAWSAYYAAKRAKIPFVTTFHGTYGTDNFLKLFYNSIMTKGEIVIAVSNFIKDHIIQNYNIVSDDKIVVIHRGVDVEVFSPANVKQQNQEILRRKFKLSDNDFVILLPGRFTRWKGHHVCVDALKQIEEQVSFKAIFIGDMKQHEDYIEELKSYLDKLNLSERVIFTDHTSDMVNLYSIADLVLSTSTKAEAFGRIIPEAGALEKIVIATNIGGPAETIMNEKTGFLIDPNNSVMLANYIKMVYNLSDIERKNIGINARQFIADNFSLKNMTDKTISLYNQLGKFYL